MVLDAPGPNGPFQPVALMHFRGEMFVWCLRREGCHAMICADRRMLMVLQPSVDWRFVLTWSLWLCFETVILQYVWIQCDAVVLGGSLVVCCPGECGKLCLQCAGLFNRLPSPYTNKSIDVTGSEVTVSGKAHACVAEFAAHSFLCAGAHDTWVMRDMHDVYMCITCMTVQ